MGVALNRSFKKVLCYNQELTSKMRVSSCCCGCSLETGCKIIAILGLIFGGIGFITSILAWETLNGADIFGNILEIVAASLLLWGTLKNKYIPVLAYLIIQVGSIFSELVVFVILTVSGALMAGGNQEQAVEGTPSSVPQCTLRLSF